MKHHLWLSVLFLGILLSSASAQETEIDLSELENLSAEEEASLLQSALNKDVNVSSKKALSLRESPSIVSVITSEEILNSGARDLIDVLRLVPGFDFASDVDFMVGLGVRGNWASEGKVLLIIDGIEYNEILYQTLQFGNHFNPDQIERIEVIRGPGSAVYGGSAEYGVINITTKGGSGFEGASVNGTYGQLDGTYGRRNLGMTVGKTIGDVQLDFSSTIGQGVRSDQVYQDLYQSEPARNVSDNSKMDISNFGLGMKYKGLTVRAVYDDYKTSEGLTYDIDYTSFFGLIKYDIQATEKLKITPSIHYSDQLPWYYKVQETGEDDFKLRATRLRGNVTASYDINRKLNVVLGAEAFQDQATDELETGHFGGENDISFNMASFFVQALYEHRIANVTAGFRYDNHQAFGSVLVPRLALTKRINNFHFKALYSGAYRAPSIENINIQLPQDPIRPEQSRVLEFELGYQFTPDMLLSANVFNIQTSDVIVYDYNLLPDGTEVDWYFNAEQSGSSGFELEYRVKKKNWYVTTGYSYYLASANSQATSFLVNADPSVFIAFPAHRLTVNSHFKVGDHFSANPSLIYASKRYAYTEVDANFDPVLTELESYLLANLFFNYENVLNGLNIGIGAFDLLNQKPVTPQAYNGDYAPIPGRSRELLVKLNYTIPFKR